MEILKNFFSTLNKEAVKYMVAGGMAVNLYGIERATADIDIVLKLDNENLSKFVHVAKKLGLKPKVPVKLDVFVEMPLNFNKAYKKKIRMKLDDTTIPVVPIKELIEMKEKSGRLQDRADVFYLKKISKDWKDEK